MLTTRKYNEYCCDKKYLDICNLLGIKADSPADATNKLADAVTNLAKEIGLGTSFKEMGIDKKEFESKIQEIAVLAYEDQCSPANPRVPIVKDMEIILEKSYEGVK